MIDRPLGDRNAEYPPRGDIEAVMEPCVDARESSLDNLTVELGRMSGEEVLEHVRFGWAAEMDSLLRGS